VADAHYEDPRLAALYDPLDSDRLDLEVYAAMAAEFGAREVLDIGGRPAYDHVMERERRDQLLAALTRLGRSVADRVMRWRGHPPEDAGVREPRRPRTPLTGAAIALAEPRAGLRRRLGRGR
jgi:hypothetical protein